MEAGVCKFKKKTVNALISHILDTIPTSTGDYFQLIATHFLRALGYLLEQPAIAGGLKNVRYELIDFSLDGIELYLGNIDGDLSESGSGISHPSIPKYSSRLGNTQKVPSSVSRPNVEGLCQILLSLLSTTNNPSSPALERVAAIMIRLLQYQSSNVSKLHQVAFSVLNIVLSFVGEDRTLFSFSIGRDLLPLICRLWQGNPKDEMINSVRDEMLISLFHIHLHLESNIMSNEDVELHNNLKDLLEALRADYSRRADRDQLQLEDLEILDLSSQETCCDSFRLHSFRLGSHINRTAERSWANLLAMAILERLVRVRENVHPVKFKPGDDSNFHPRKRQRVSPSSDRLLEPLRTGEQNIRLAGLQLIPFLLHDCILSVSSLKELLDHLHDCALDKRSNIASWALLGIARSVSTTPVLTYHD